ncbi:MAG: hypothetical protein JJU02_05385 [Cryomorphaceae bacterium]|nr:hypothetical protein [Cryomorphaceae bacterium]
MSRVGFSCVVILCIALSAKAQPIYQIDLTFDEENSSLSVLWNLEWTNDTGEQLDSFPLVFPLQSVGNPSSFFRKEKLENQDKTLHFAHDSKLSRLDTFSFLLGKIPVRAKFAPDSEILWVFPDRPIQPGEKVWLHAIYSVLLGDGSLFPVGFVEQDLWLQYFTFLLPPHHPEKKWLFTPLNEKANFVRRRADFTLSFLFPEDYEVFSNGFVTPGSGESKQIHIKNKQDVFLIVSKSAYIKDHLTNRGNIWSTINPGPYSNFFFNIAEQSEVYLNERFAQNPGSDYGVISVPYRVNYFDPGLGVVLLPENDQRFDFAVSGVLSAFQSYLSSEVSHALAYFQTFVKTEVPVNFFIEPWLGDGLAHFLRDDFLRTNDFDLALSGKLTGSIWSRFFLWLDDLDFDYQNHLMYTYLARKGLDQPIGDAYPDISMANYLAITEGKTSIAIGHLKGYIGPRSFYTAFQHWFKALDTTNYLGRVALEQSLRDNSRKSVDWFFNHYLDKSDIVDYEITSIDKCNYVYAVTVKNHGKAPLPYKLTGVKNGEAVISIWFDGHIDKKTIQFNLDDYDEIILDRNLETADYNHRNHRMKEKGLFRSTNPLRFQLYTGIEDPKKNQIFFQPVGGLNAYDGIYGGVAFFNNTIIPKKYEYRIEPTLSTLPMRLTGRASFVNNQRLSSGWFHRITSGVFFTNYHYDTDLRYYRYSPFVRFWWRKSHPRSENIHRTRFRFLQLAREGNQDMLGGMENASYWLAQVSHDYENTNILRPCSLRTLVEVSEQFVKLQADFDQRWMLPNKKWLTTRLFAGVFAYNNLPANQDFFRFGLSGTLDYAFDYYLLGRSETSGFWSQQMIITDGGFKSRTDVFAGSWITAFNVNVPLYQFIGVFGDVGFVDNLNTLYWDYGVRVSIFTDFLELYFPIQNHDRIMWDHAYPSEIRFVLNMDFNSLIQRLRRGWF